MSETCFAIAVMRFTQSEALFGRSTVFEVAPRPLFSRKSRVLLNLHPMSTASVQLADRLHILVRHRTKRFSEKRRQEKDMSNGFSGKPPRWKVVIAKLFESYETPGRTG